MIEVSVPISAFGFAPGIADADRIGASAKVQAANPIHKSRFMMWLFLGSRYRDVFDNASAHTLGGGLGAEGRPAEGSCTWV
jgi:hypothetical protein